MVVAGRGCRHPLAQSRGCPRGGLRNPRFARQRARSRRGSGRRGVSGLAVHASARAGGHPPPRWQILAERKQQIGEIIAREAGKPLAEGCGDVQEAIDMAELAAGEGRRLYGDTAPSELPDKLCLTAPRADRRLRAGHAVEFPRGHSRLEMLPRPDLRQHGSPQAGLRHAALRGRVRPRAGRRRAAARRHQSGAGPRLGRRRGDVPQSATSRLISITGSTETGKHVAAECGRTGKRVSLECGGKNAEIVMDDANLDLAVEGALWGAFGTSGHAARPPAG